MNIHFHFLLLFAFSFQSFAFIYPHAIFNRGSDAHRQQGLLFNRGIKSAAFGPKQLPFDSINARPYKDNRPRKVYMPSVMVSDALQPLHFMITQKDFVNATTCVISLQNENAPVILPTIGECNYLLTALSTAGMHRVGISLATVLSSWGMDMSTVNLRSLIDNAVLWGGAAELFHIQEHISSGRLTATLQLYNYILEAYAKTGDSDRAIQCLHEMSTVGGIHPTLYSVNMVIKACSISKNIVTSYAAFSELLRLGIAPNNQTYIYLVDTCCRAGRFDAALQLLRSTVDSGNYYPLLSTNVLVLKLIARTSPQVNIESALQLLRMLSGAKLGHSEPVVVSALLEAYVAHKNLTQLNSTAAHELFEFAARRRPVPVQACQALLQLGRLHSNAELVVDALRYCKARVYGIDNATETSARNFLGQVEQVSVCSLILLFVQKAVTLCCVVFCLLCVCQLHLLDAEKKYTKRNTTKTITNTQSNQSVSCANVSKDSYKINGPAASVFGSGSTQTGAAGAVSSPIAPAVSGSGSSTNTAITDGVTGVKTSASSASKAGPGVSPGGERELRGHGTTPSPSAPYQVYPPASPDSTSSRFLSVPEVACSVSVSTFIVPVHGDEAANPSGRTYTDTDSDGGVLGIYIAGHSDEAANPSGRTYTDTDSDGGVLGIYIAGHGDEAANSSGRTYTDTDSDGGVLGIYIPGHGDEAANPSGRTYTDTDSDGGVLGIYIPGHRDARSGAIASDSTSASASNSACGRANAGAVAPSARGSVTRNSYADRKQFYLRFATRVSKLAILLVPSKIKKLARAVWQQLVPYWEEYNHRWCC
jgi:pentatricopeptide repeat protein